jgi:hypothetical protein
MTDGVSDTGRDKMELAEADEGSRPAGSLKYTDAFLLDSDLVGIRRPTCIRAPPMHRRHDQDHPDPDREGARLRDRRHRVLRRHLVPGLQQLSGNTLDQLRAGHRQEVAVDPAKRHPEDFALWKKAGPNRALTWPEPLGRRYRDGTSSARRCR